MVVQELMDQGMVGADPAFYALPHTSPCTPQRGGNACPFYVGMKQEKISSVILSVGAYRCSGGGLLPSSLCLTSATDVDI